MQAYVATAKRAEINNLAIDLGLSLLRPRALMRTLIHRFLRLPGAIGESGYRTVSGLGRY